MNNKQTKIRASSKYRDFHIKPQISKFCVLSFAKKHAPSFYAENIDKGAFKGEKKAFL